MKVLIDMEMPKCCFDCQLSYMVSDDEGFDHDYCAAIEGQPLIYDLEGHNKRRPDECPLNILLTKDEVIKAVMED